MPSARPARSASRSRVPRSGGTGAHCAIEPADVDVAQVQVMDGDVAGDRQALLLRGAHHRDAFRRREPAQVDAHAGLAHQRQDRRQRDRLRDRRDRRQAEARRHLAVVRDAAARRGARPAAAATRDGRRSPRTASRAAARCVSASGDVGLRERDAARLARARPSRSASSPCEPRRSARRRIHVRLVERARAVLQHLDQARLVERRIGVGRTREARDAAGDRRLPSPIRASPCTRGRARAAARRGR